MGQFHFYITPFQENGDMGTEEIEITKEVILSGISSLSQDLDNSDYDVGVFRNSRITMKLKNEQGKFSATTEVGSIFVFKRNDTPLRISWEPAGGLYCGFFDCGEGDTILSEEVTLFNGIINDDTSTEDIENQSITLNVLGLDSIFSREKVETADITNGDLISDAIFAILDKTKITNFVSVISSNINVQVDVEIDDATKLHGKNCREAVNDLLFASNSVLYIQNGEVVVTDRSPSASVEQTFYGQAAQAGSENIVNLSDYRAGLNKTFNFWKWSDTTLQALDSTSIIDHGVIDREINFDFITDNTSRQSILDSFKDEFGNPKRELALETPLTPEVLQRLFLDQIAIDYPSIVFPAAEAEALAQYGSAEYDVDRYAAELSNFTITTADTFKIIAKRVNMRSETIELELREI